MTIEEQIMCKVLLDAYEKWVEAGRPMGDDDDA